MNYLKENSIYLPGLSEKESELVSWFETQGEIIFIATKRKNWSSMTSCLENAHSAYEKSISKISISNLCKSILKDILVRNINKSRDLINDQWHSYEKRIIDSYLEKII